MTSRVGHAALGFAVCALAASIGCGLRTDPDYSPVCIDHDAGLADDTGGTADTGDTMGQDPAEPRRGSCEDPIDIPTGQTVVVRGSLGGCSGTEGWCGGTGAEDVYRIGSITGDVFIDFLPQETNFNPVLRVVRTEDPCLEGIIEESEICADITNSVPGRGFYDLGGPNDTYYIIVDTELGEAGQYAFEARFGTGAFAGDCLDAVDEQTIELMSGGNFVWEASLEAKQGRLDSGCGAPGDEDIFALILTGGGTMTATVERIEGDDTFVPTISLRNDCGTATEMACGDTVSRSFGGSTTAYLVVDQTGASDGRYRLTVNY